MRVNGITGIIVDKVKRDLIEKSLIATNGVTYVIDADSTTEQLAVELFGVYDARPREELVRCVNCKGISSEKDDEECPYCGHDTADPIDEKKEEAPVAASASSEEEKPGLKKTKGEEVMSTTQEQKLVKVKANGKGSKLATARTEQDLDAAVIRVQKAKSEAGASGWRLGKEIAAIVDGQLWKLRAEEEAGKTKPRFTSFEAFCVAELNMTPKNAHSLADVSRQFTEEQALSWGTSKLGLLLTAPAETQREILSENNGSTKKPSKREIAEKVRKAKKDKSHTREARDKSSRGATSTPKPKKNKPSITVASLLKSHTVPLYKCPATRKGIDIKTLARAKKIGDIPFGVLELTNEVSLYIKIGEDSKGQLVGKLVFERED